MACGDDMKTLLSRHVDGELSPEERARVEEHVAACAPCRELLQIFQKNESILSNALSTASFSTSRAFPVPPQSRTTPEPERKCTPTVQPDSQQRSILYDFALLLDPMRMPSPKPAAPLMTESRTTIKSTLRVDACE